jgi:hypothetical protein
MKNRRVSNDKLKVIRNYLPQGSNKIIAGITGLTPIYVSKVLHGVHLNLNVIEEAVKIALEEKSKAETLNTILEDAFK